MFSFFRAKAVPPPAWCSLDASSYAFFRKTIARRFPNATNEDFERGAIDGPAGTMFLQNIALRLIRVPRGAWAKSFDDYLRSAEEVSVTGELSTEELRRRLRVRLISPQRYHPDFHFEGPMLADDLMAAFAIDLPTKMMFATAAQVAQLDASQDELLSLGIENVMRDPAPKPTPMAVGKATLQLYESEEMYAASRLVRLDSLTAVSPNGALAIVPTGHLLGVVNITGLTVIDALNTLPLVAKRFFEHEHPCSPSVYWWRAGSIERVPIDIDGKTIGVHPTDTFLEMLNTLS